MYPERCVAVNWTFQPRPWAIIGVLVGCALTIHLGRWQLHRGHAREALSAQYADAEHEKAVDLRVDTPVPADVAALAAVAEGVYLDQQLLLDNQVRDRIPGYHVLSPMRLSSGGIVMINRGWVPQNPDRRRLPQLTLPSSTVSVHGLWRALPEPALHLKTDNCSTIGWPRITEYPTPADLSCIYAEKVAAGMLLLDPDAADGYSREWTQTDARFPPSRNYAYAAQWFAFAATLLVLFITLNLKRRK